MQAANVEQADFPWAVCCVCECCNVVSGTIFILWAFVPRKNHGTSSLSFAPSGCVCRASKLTLVPFVSCLANPIGEFLSCLFHLRHIYTLLPLSPHYERKCIMFLSCLSVSGLNINTAKAFLFIYLFMYFFVCLILVRTLHCIPHAWTPSRERNRILRYGFAWYLKSIGSDSYLFVFNECVFVSPSKLRARFTHSFTELSFVWHSFVTFTEAAYCELLISFVSLFYIQFVLFSLQLPYTENAVTQQLVQSG